LGYNNFNIDKINGNFYILIARRMMGKCRSWGENIDVGVQFPLRYRYRSPWTIGLVFSLVGPVFASLGVIFLYKTLSGGQAMVAHNPPLALGIGFVVLGLIALIVGLSQFGSMDIKIDGRVVYFEKKSVWSRAKWQEPLTSFHQIETGESYRRTGTSNIEFQIELAHCSDPKKNVPLYVHGLLDQKFFFQRAEVLARLFKLPLQGRGPGNNAKAAVDLEKNLKTLIQEKKIQYQFDPMRFPVIAGAEFRRSGEEIKVLVKRASIPWGIVIFLILFFWIFIYLTIYPKGYPTLFVGIGIGLMAKIAASRVFSELVLHQKGIFYRVQFLNHVLRESSMPWQEIKEISIAKKSGGNVTTLKLGGAQKVLEIGNLILYPNHNMDIWEINLGFSAQILTWLRNAIFYHIDQYTQ
jgi:hypothetical protein